MLDQSVSSHIQALEKANRQLQKKLERAEATCLELDATNQRKEALLRQVLQETREAQAILEQRTIELDRVVQQLEQEISDRKAAEARLQCQEEFLRCVYEGAAQPIFVIDVLPNDEFRYAGWNAAAAAASGLTSSEICGKPPEEIYGEAAAAMHPYLQATVTSGQSIRHEERLEREGKESWWMTTYNPLTDHDGRVFRLIGTTFDITEQKAIETALQDYANQQTLLNRLASQIRHSLDVDAIIATTLQSIRDLLDIDHCAFAWYNPENDPPSWDMIQEAKQTDCPSGLGSYPAPLVGPIDQFLFKQTVLRIDDAHRYPEATHRAFLESIQAQSEMLLPIQTHSNRIGVVICIHYRQVRPWLDSEVELLQAVGDPLAIAIDQASLYAESRSKRQELEQTLIELQHTQAQMVQSEKMSSLGQLVAGIAHEINNPVNFIHGNITPIRDYTSDLLKLVSLYQRTYPDEPPAIADQIKAMDLAFLKEDLPSVLASMKVGTDRIREIVKSLRLFSRLDESEFKAVNIHDGIDSTLMILRNRLKAKTDQSEIRVIKTYGTLPPVECFAGQLNQVFMNILVNAIDAIEDVRRQCTHPTIHITTELTADRQAVIRIADNGPGMPEAVQQRIFDPFFTTKPIGQGTGMGMSISYQIITEKHGGQLSCYSRPGEGTEFVIQIPICQEMTA